MASEAAVAASSSDLAVLISPTALPSMAAAATMPVATRTNGLAFITRFSAPQASVSVPSVAATVSQSVLLKNPITSWITSPTCRRPSKNPLILSALAEPKTDSRAPWTLPLANWPNAVAKSLMRGTISLARLRAQSAMRPAMSSMIGLSAGSTSEVTAPSTFCKLPSTGKSETPTSSLKLAMAVPNAACLAAALSDTSARSP